MVTIRGKVVEQAKEGATSTYVLNAFTSSNGFNVCLWIFSITEASNAALSSNSIIWHGIFLHPNNLQASNLLQLITLTPAIEFIVVSCSSVTPRLSFLCNSWRRFLVPG